MSWVAADGWPLAEGKRGCLGSRRWVVGHTLTGREELKQKRRNERQCKGRTDD